MTSRRQFISLLGGAADHVRGEVMVTVPVGRVRGQFMGGKGPGAVHQQALFFA